MIIIILMRVVSFKRYRSLALMLFEGADVIEMRREMTLGHCNERVCFRG